METILQQSVSENYTINTTKPTFLKRFVNWTTEQDKNRFAWIGAAVAGHGCVLTPFTLFAIIIGGNNIVFWMLAIVAMMATLVTNLAAMPTKITIPVFLLSIVIDIIVIASCLSGGLNLIAVNG